MKGSMFEQWPAILLEGVFDIGDDTEGGYGGDEVRMLMARRKEAGDFLTG
jgi:hypothetical protein